MRYTQKQLEEMSDFELNIELSLIEAKGYERNVKSVEYDESQKCIWVESAGFTSFPVKDYCNNWADIGPFIFECKIAIDFVDGFGWSANDSYGESECSNYNNPLRAAAIVYILIKQGE